MRCRTAPDQPTSEDDLMSALSMHDRLPFDEATAPSLVSRMAILAMAPPFAAVIISCAPAMSQTPGAMGCGFRS